MVKPPPSKHGLSAEEAAWPLSRYTFWWVLPFLQDTYREITTGIFSPDMLPAPPSSEQVGLAIDRLADQIRKEIQAVGVGAPRRAPSMHRAILRCWRPLILPQIALVVFLAVLFTLPPLLLQLVVQTMSSEQPLYVGFLSVLAMVSLGLCGGLLQQRSFHTMSRLGREMWMAMVGNMFDKLAKLDSSSFGHNFSEGQVLSMIGQDASSFPYLSPFFSVFILMPCNIVFPSLVLLYFLREAFAAGLAVCLFVAFVSDNAASAYQRRVTAKFQAADARIVLLNEALQGIRSVKLCAWEVAIEARVTAAREKEMKLLLWIQMLYALQQGVVSAMPVIACTVTFLTHAALGRELEATTVMMAIAYFDQLALGFVLLPNTKMQLQTMSAGIVRIGKLLLQPETFRVRPAALPGEQLGIQLVEAGFQWQMPSPNTPVAAADLRGITVSVLPGQLVVVVGRVASGKSTLVAGVFGLARLAEGTAKMVGKGALLPQNPQILNASLRDNILFGATYEEQRYQKAIDACCLEQDLKQLADGDDTEIGEKGITVSGGQRARIALARAYYADADVVVLDDPMSAMDAHVGAEVFRRCILDLRSQGKAVLLATNQLQLCSQADQVLVLDAGLVSEQGSFSELMSRPGSLLASLVCSAAHEDEEGTGGAGSGNEAKKDTSEQGVAHGHTNLRPTVLLRRKSGIAIEGRIEGRVGPKEWLQLARSVQSSCLLGVLILFCLLVPVFLYLSSLTLTLWTAASVGSGSPLAAHRELALYVAAGTMLTLCCIGRVTSEGLYFVCIARRLHARMLAAVLRQPLLWYDTTPLGRILNRFSQDIALTDLMMPRVFEFAAQHNTAVLVDVIGAGVLAWPALVLFMPLLWPIWRLHQRYGTVAVNLQRVMLMSTSPVVSKVSSFLTALDTIRAFGRESMFTSDFRLAMSDFATAYYWIHSTDRLAMALITILCIPTLILFMGLAVIPMARNGFLSPELGGLALALACGLAQRIPLSLWTTSTVEKFFGGAQRVAEYGDLPWEGNAVDHSVWIKDRMRAPREHDWLKAAVAGAPALEFQDVHMRYQPELPRVLQGLSLKVWPGEKLGVCGRTGSGKSTLFLASFRMVDPESGSILLSGIDTKTVPLSILRSQLAIVPQDPLMFSGTLRSNLDFHGRHSEAELWAALRLARLESQVISLPLGLEEPVREKGSNFSGGTVQLLCIARILLTRQQIVFLDECTASVDFETDAAVQAAVRVAFKECAVICIAHRLHTVVDYDRIACLDGGRLADSGSPHELLQRDGHFSRLVESLGAAGSAEIRQKALLASLAAKVAAMDGARELRSHGTVSV